MAQRQIDDGLAISTPACRAEVGARRAGGGRTFGRRARGASERIAAPRRPKKANDHERNGARTSGVTKFSSRSSQRQGPCGHAIATQIMWEVYTGSATFS